MFRLTITCLTVCLLGTAFVQTADAAVVFNIDSSTMVVGGMINGAPLQPTPIMANTAVGLSGEIVAIINNSAHPTAIQIIDGTMDVATNYGNGPFRPGIGGDDSFAYGDFAFQATPNELFELAIRDLNLDFSSDVLPLSGGSAFRADQVSMVVGIGNLDVRSPSMGGSRYDMAGLSATSSEEALGTLLEIETSGEYLLTMPYERSIDISPLMCCSANSSYLTISGTITAQAQAIPEPSTLTVLLCMSAVGIFISGRRKRSRS